MSTITEPLKGFAGTLRRRFNAILPWKRDPAAHLVRLLQESNERQQKEHAELFIAAQTCRLVGLNKIWYKYGVIHRDDGPAIECSDGTTMWYHNGVREREDGPAVEWSYGKKEWYRKGRLHREGGPAVENPDGNKEWWLNGVQTNPAGIPLILQFDFWIKAIENCREGTPESIPVSRPLQLKRYKTPAF